MMLHTLHSLVTTDLDVNIFIKSNYLTWCVVLTYVTFSKVGPSFMKNRKPLDLQMLLIIYNGILVACNVYVAYSAAFYSVKLWPYRCDFKNSPVYENEKSHHFFAWAAFFVKFAELFDTVFFVLRKKFNQISFLHVFHHSIVLTMYWICLNRRLEGYYIVLIGAINCSVHVILYLYYGLSAFGPGVRKYLWWKKYLTRLQITQFFVIGAYLIQSFFSGCEQFGYFEKMVLLGLVAVTALFLNFYKQTYRKEKTL